MNHNLKALTVWVLRYPRNTSSEGSQQTSMLEFAAFLKFRPWNEEHERKLTSSPMIRVEHRGGRGVRRIYNVLLPVDSFGYQSFEKDYVEDEADDLKPS